ncbi:MAG: hypothetical protein HYV28_05375 [Ignavibacteriales bacterium]|nr:hypothetical protein [Ignavibacteriales bacterium]
MTNKELLEQLYINARATNETIREMEVFIRETEDFILSRKTSFPFENEYYPDLNQNYLYHHNFPNLYRYSILISIIIFFENEVKFFHNLLFEASKADRSFDKIGNKGERPNVADKLKYILEFIGIEITYEFGYPIVNDLIFFRNHVVHETGEIDTIKYRDRILEFNRKFGEFGFAKNKLVLSKGFCLKALQAVDATLNYTYRSTIEFIEYN